METKGEDIEEKEVINLLIHQVIFLYIDGIFLFISFHFFVGEDIENR
jgi:hypothetical protein